MIHINNRVARIRESERKSHTIVYTNEKLYKSDSWLQRPIKTVRETVPFFAGYKELRVLDLGCGIGRNSIFIAEQYSHINCSVDCVDLLPIAIDKLLQNATAHNVLSHINGIIKSIEEYKIQRNSYDFILAISSLEHVDSQESFFQKLLEIKAGVHKNGIVCLIMNSDVVEMCVETNEPIEAQFEVNLPTETIQAFLDEIFYGWEILKNSVATQQYDIPREAYISRLNTKVITYVVRRNK